jgi:hypothetical protein
MIDSLSKCGIILLNQHLNTGKQLKQQYSKCWIFIL